MVALKHWTRSQDTMIYSWFFGHWPLCNLDQGQFSIKWEVRPFPAVTFWSNTWQTAAHGSNLITPIYLHIVCGCFHLQLRCGRLGPETHKAENIYSPGFYGKCLLTLLSSVVPAHVNPLYSLTLILIHSTNIHWSALLCKVLWKSLKYNRDQYSQS